MAIPRRTLTELSYEMRQAGKTHLLVVEGPSDKRAVAYWLSDCESLHVQSVSSIQVPDEWVSLHSAHGSNRALVASLAISWKIEEFHVAGLVDRDCGMPSDWSGLEGLFVTDYPALESYACTAKCLGKFLALTLGAGGDLSSETLLLQISPALRSLFNYRREFGSPKMAHDKFLAVDGGVVRVRTEKLCGAKSVESCTDWSVLQSSCYGHDLAPVLIARFPNEMKNRAGLKSPEAVERVLLSTIDDSWIAGERAFLEIRAWYEG